MATAKKKKLSHGGRRPGSGRPRVDDPTISVGARIRKSTVQRLGAIMDAASDDNKQTQDITMSQIVSDAVEEYVDRHSVLPTGHIRK